MAKKSHQLYYSYSPVTQELMVTTVSPEDLDKVDNVMLDTDHYLQVDPKTGQTKGFFVLFVEADADKEIFGEFPQKDDIKMIDLNQIIPKLN